METKTDIIIVGAGPVALFTVFEAGLLGLECVLIDNLDKVGGQCSELYPGKPIYDIPGVPYQTAQEHVNALLEQIKPFKHEIHLNQRVNSLEEIVDEEISSWKVTTSEENVFIAKSLFIAAGAGSFEPRRPPNIENPDQFLDKGVSYSVKDKNRYKDRWISKIRDPYERVFSKQNKRVRYRGVTKNQFAEFMNAICFNIKRLAVITSLA